MQLNTTTNSGLEQRLELFEPAIGEEEVGTTFKKNENERELFEKHREKYSASIYVPDWQEVVLVLEGSNPSVNPRNLELLTTTSYHLQAVRKGGANDITPISVEGLILTRDNKFVYGIRGGNVERGKVCVSPAGSLSNHHKGDNPLFATLYKELREELGIETEASDKPILIGYQTDPDFTKGVNFVFYMHSGKSSKEIDEKHKEALDVYQRALSKNVPEVEARKEIGRAGFPNIDAWEHTNLVFVDDNPKMIDRIIQSRRVPHDGKEYPVLDIGRGALILYKACP